MRVTMAIGNDVLKPNTTVVTALLHSPDSRIGLRPNLIDDAKIRTERRR
jgi:hypothetical protein